MFIEALFTTARTWKQPKCPLTEKWIKVWYVMDKEGMDRVNKQNGILLRHYNEWNNAICSHMDEPQFSSVTQSCPTLCDPMNCSTPGLPVHHQLQETTKTHVHWVGDDIQPSHPLSSPSPPAFILFQHQGLFQWVSSSHQGAKVLEFQLLHQSFQRIFKTDFLWDWPVGFLQYLIWKASILRHSAFFMVQLSHPYMTTGKIIALTR